MKMVGEVADCVQIRAACEQQTISSGLDLCCLSFVEWRNFWVHFWLGFFMFDVMGVFIVVGWKFGGM